eukprot:444938-Amphidinium_carterae.1
MASRIHYLQFDTSLRLGFGPWHLESKSLQPGRCVRSWSSLMAGTLSDMLLWWHATVTFAGLLRVSGSCADLACQHVEIRGQFLHVVAEIDHLAKDASPEDLVGIVWQCVHVQAVSGTLPFAGLQAPQLGQVRTLGTQGTMTRTFSTPINRVHDASQAQVLARVCCNGQGSVLMLPD